MHLTLDASSPTPLYHQIAESLRYRIGTGALAPGALLPPVRKAAEDWAVNLHTVRRAYRLLAEDGLVEMKRPSGTRVVEAPAAIAANAPSRELRDFLARTLREAVDGFGLSLDELVRYLRVFHPATDAAPSKVHVIECSEAQCASHAAEITARWNVQARTHPLDRPGEPPGGPLVATYFHFNEIRRRWPRRLPDVQFVAIHPDPGLADRLGRDAPDGEPITVLLCELDAGQAHSVAADLELLLPADRFRIETRVVRQANELLEKASQERQLLFTPRVWAGLTAIEQARDDIHPLDYVIKASDLAELGRRFGWSERMSAVRVA